MGSILRSSFADKVTGNDSFLLGIIGGAAFIPMMAMYIRLTRIYPGKNLFQMAELALGKVLGKLVGAAFILYFVSLGCVNMHDIGSFVTEYILRNGPAILVLAASGAAVAYILRKGPVTLMRIIPLFAIIAVAIFIVSLFQLFNRMDFMNLLPIFTLSPAKYAQGAMITVAIPYGESLTLFALLPFVRPGVSVRKPIILSALFTFMMMTVLYIRDISILGPLLSYTSLPSYEVYRMINSFNSIARVESLHATVIVTVMTIKVTIVIYAIAQGIASVFNLESEKPLFLPVSMFISVYAASFRLSRYGNMEWSLALGPIIWLTFELVLPLFILIGSVIRKKHAEPEPEHSRESGAIA